MIVSGLLAIILSVAPIQEPRLPETRLLELDGDIASRLVDGVDRFLLRRIETAAERRKERWRESSEMPAHRERLARITGIRDPRLAFSSPELLARVGQSSLAGRTSRTVMHRVRWPVFEDVFAEGLLLVPSGEVVADIVAIPDAGLSPEQISGLADGLPPSRQYARLMAESGCRVLVPALISRTVDEARAGLTRREFLYRSAFELGRHLIGLEVQEVLAAVDWLERDGRPVGAVGWGEGGLVATVASALDPRIDAALVSGYLGSLDRVWQEPIDRNVFGWLERFGGAELMAMIGPRPLIVEVAPGPDFEVPTGGRGAPGQLHSPSLEEVQDEVDRLPSLGVSDLGWLSLVSATDWMSTRALETFLHALAEGAELRASEETPERLGPDDPMTREERLVRRLERHHQRLLGESPYVRADFMKGLRTESLEDYEESTKAYREIFARDVIGRFDLELSAPAPRSRLYRESERWTAYEIVLDVFEDVIAYGILLIPKGIEPGEKRPVVVCQHGLEGRPKDVIEGDHWAYHDFAARLADRGFITFAPQNLYLFGDRFRTLQRKANLLGKTLFSIIVPQHQQIVDWLQTLPFVDPERIAFYGLSYGGKTCMRVVPLVEDYCLGICSADF
ncbi:MAG: hypothetical protein RL885_33185, partial [Planctomycetota bacterium]